MATRSTIAIENADGTVHQIYCHWDGGFWHVGPTLYNHYQDRSKVEQLIAGGDISILEESIGEQHDFNKPTEGWTLYYGRDRGEDNVDAKVFADFDDYEQNHQYEEFEYFYTQAGVWRVFYDKSDDESEWYDLGEELEIAKEAQ